MVPLRRARSDPEAHWGSQPHHPPCRRARCPALVTPAITGRASEKAEREPCTCSKQACENGPSLAPRIISASAVGLYGHSAQTSKTEAFSTGTRGFLADVVREWEDPRPPIWAASAADTSRLRIGLVMSAKGGVLEAPAAHLYGMGLGAPLASGGQFQSWIHIDDLVGHVDGGIWPTARSGMAHTMPWPQTPCRKGRIQPEPWRGCSGGRTFFPNVPAGSICGCGLAKPRRRSLASHKVRPERLLEAGYCL